MEYAHVRYLIPDQSGEGNNILIEANWNKAVAPAQKIRFTDQSGATFIIDRKHLLGAIFMLGDEEDQMQMVTGTHREVRFRKHKVTQEFGPILREHIGTIQRVTSEVELPVAEMHITDVLPKNVPKGLHRVS